MSKTPFASENPGRETPVSPPERYSEPRNGTNALRECSVVSPPEQAQRNKSVENNMQYQQRLKDMFRPGPNGVIGLVDSLLELCREIDLQLDWLDGQCHVQTLGEESHEIFNLPLQKSVFRALLARISALCDVCSSEPVSPYGGVGRISIGAASNAWACLYVVFSNTKDTQRVTIRSGSIQGTAKDL